MTIYVGTSGWQYRDWKNAFYIDVPQRQWLPAFAERFETVEINNAFYRLPEKATFRAWHDATPDDFIFAVKMSRYLTHIKRLKDPEEPVKRFLDRSEELQKKLGPVLLQLPPNLQLSFDALEYTLKQFPKHIRVCVEPRHESWFTDEVRALLEHHNAALCLADSPHFKTPTWQTADWGYVRFHEGKASPHPCYGKAALTTWAERIADLWPQHADVYVYFNNDTNACALRDAGMFAGELEKLEQTVSRHPAPSEIELQAV